jgi:2-dehydropantoate 2-reductase
VKLLIFGCGVIGSVYAAHFAGAGYDVTVYARGRRLLELQEKGLLYESAGQIRRAPVYVTGTLDGTYDFAFVTVKYEQLTDAIREIRPLHCPTIVTMVNNPKGYAECEQILGCGRLLPAFPGAGGVIENGVLKAGLTPAVIQKTTFGEISGKCTERTAQLGRIFRNSHIPCKECGTMMDWQLCHLGLVVPLADAIYRSKGDNYAAGRSKEIMFRAAREVQRNLILLSQTGTKLCPPKMHLLVSLPVPVFAAALGKLYCSDFGSRFINGHSQKAVTEMMQLRRDYYSVLKERIGYGTSDQ